MSPDRSLFTQLIKINLNTLSLLNHLLLTKVKKTLYERFTESFSPLVLKVCVFSADIRPFCKPYRYPAAVFEYLAEIYENSGLSGRISDQPNNWCILGYRTSLIFFFIVLCCSSATVKPVGTETMSGGRAAHRRLLSLHVRGRQRGLPPPGTIIGS